MEKSKSRIVEQAKSQHDEINKSGLQKSAPKSPEMEDSPEKEEYSPVDRKKVKNWAQILEEEKQALE